MPNRVVMPAALATCLLAGCASGGGMAAPGLPVAAFHPEDRVVLGDLATVRAVAATFDRVVVAYNQDLGIWRPLDRRWEVPRRPRDPGLLREVFLALIDPLDRSVWLATRTGWVRYTPESDLWERGSLPGTVQGAGLDVADPIGGPWFRTSAGWFQQGRAGPARPGTPPRTLRLAPTLEDAYRDMPQLRAFGPTMAIGPRLEAGRLTAAAPSADGTGWFVGTSGRGLLFVDRMAVNPQPMPIGIGGEVVGALVQSGNGLWISTDADAVGRPAAVTWLGEELDEVVQLTGNPATGLPFGASRHLMPGDRALWAGTDRGLVRLDVDGQQTPRLWGEGSGLPIPQVTSMTQWRDRIAIGTTRGLAVLEGETIRRIAPGFFEAVYALAPRGDTLWVGSSLGLGAMLDGDTTIRVSTGWRIAAQGRVPVMAIGQVADTMVVMTPERLVWRDPVSGAWTAGPQLSRLGTLRAMAVADAGVWVGGDRGAALVWLNTGPIRTLVAGGDVPGPVTALAVSTRYLWVGTTDGLVRIALGGR